MSQQQHEVRSRAWLEQKPTLLWWRNTGTQARCLLPLDSFSGARSH